jgi:Adenylate and Guanylate cyclase catalytic domain
MCRPANFRCARKRAAIPLGFAYDVWGDTVNIASRIEAASEPNRVLVSAVTAKHLDKDFKLDGPHKISVARSRRRVVRQVADGFADRRIADWNWDIGPAAHPSAEPARPYSPARLDSKPRLWITRAPDSLGC